MAVMGDEGTRMDLPLSVSKILYVIKRRQVVEQGYRSDLEAYPPIPTANIISSFLSDPYSEHQQPTDSLATLQDKGEFHKVMDSQALTGGYLPEKELLSTNISDLEGDYDFCKESNEESVDVEYEAELEAGKGESSEEEFHTETYGIEGWGNEFEPGFVTHACACLASFRGEADEHDLGDLQFMPATLFAMSFGNVAAALPPVDSVVEKRWAEAEVEEKVFEQEKEALKHSGSIAKGGRMKRERGGCGGCC
ncbi:hypothetical protein FA15DRAFT_661988 [Coprinopsis marcescibilis]|uniref:Uncharacterized protein n=1 Tax=Coprinopsis marcescibilis TaxID=230819 RepID=A0A5C3K9W9_COPMA|nr:hypothetical protein FA15DRAFT_661988 [Coprinopsis marcescibilis]